jgi:hypothetical protein
LSCNLLLTTSIDDPEYSPLKNSYCEDSISVTSPALVRIDEVHDCDMLVKTLTDPPAPPVKTSIDPV